jgi:hypothetical protein
MKPMECLREHEAISFYTAISKCSWNKTENRTLIGEMRLLVT